MPASLTQPRIAAGVPTQKFLTFLLADEAYGIDIAEVQEIVAALPITRVPGASPFVRGVVNLRGRVIPIVDLRARLDLGRVEIDARSCIIVVRTDASRLGLLVDRVSEVADIAPGDIDAVPDVGPAARTEFLRGIGRSGSHLRLLLDLQRVLTLPDLPLATDDAADSPRVAAE
jgi:purine-binding chemotaxis protein CheW